MAIDRANIKGGPAKVTWNGATLMSRDAFHARHTPEWAEVTTSMHGMVDKAAKDFICRIPLRLWGAWENLSILFPSAVLTPAIGTRIFGTTDLPLVIHARNGDRITYHNAQLTKLADLYLGVDMPVFAADVEFTALIRNNTNPESANAYYTEDSAAYSETTFSKTNYKQQRYSAAWGTRAGFTTFQAKQGWNIAWRMQLTPDYSACVGTYDMILKDFSGQAKCIPVEPTMTQISAQSFSPGASGVAGRPLGSLLSAVSDDLVITGSGVSVTLKSAGIAEHGWSFGDELLRNGEVVWETTAGFTAGAAAARAVIS